MLSERIWWNSFFEFCHVFVIYLNRIKQNHSLNHWLAGDLKILPDVTKDPAGHSSVVISL